MNPVLRAPAGPEGDLGSGPDNVGNVLDSWSTEPQGTPGTPSPAAPPPHQVTPPPRPARTVISDNTDANRQGGDGAVQTPPTTTPPATPSTGLSEADLQRIAATAAGAVRASIPSPAAAAPAEMSDAEFAQRYGTPSIDSAFMERLMDADPNKSAVVLNAALKQTYTAALRMSHDLFQAELSKLRGEINPHISSFKSFQQAQQKTALESEFYSQNKDLANERELVNEVIDSFQAKVTRGEVKFSTKTDAFKAVADNVRKILTRMGVSPNSGQHSQTNPPSPAPRTMAAATAQGRSSTGQQPNLTPMEKVMSSWDQL